MDDYSNKTREELISELQKLAEDYNSLETDCKSKKSCK
jgi:hypothetical protein